MQQPGNLSPKRLLHAFFVFGLGTLPACGGGGEENEKKVTHGDDPVSEGTNPGEGAEPGMEAGGGTEPGELGACDGSADECEAARIINEFRAAHIQEGECNEALKWSSKMGKLAHDWQSMQGATIGHSDHGYVENVGQAYGLRRTIEYIIEYDPDIGEDHCNTDGSYEASHHCAAMFCENKTVGVGVFIEGEAHYVTMMFGDENGDPAWGF